MRSQQIPLDEALLDYLLAHSDPLPPSYEVAAARAEELGMPHMQLAPDQAILVRFLLRLIGARRVLEIGTFLGSSALVMADAVGDGGEIVCLDRDEEWTAHARRLWAEAGVSDRVQLVLGDAHETIRGVDGMFDAALIDADKAGYLDYLDQVTPRLRVGGLLMADNTLWSGRVTEPGDPGSDTEALQRFNDALRAHPGYEAAVVAVGDGLTLARRV